MKVAMIYLIYLDQGENAAFKYVDENFGKSRNNNATLKNKLGLYKKGGWEKDWLTCMYRDLDKIIKKYNLK